MNRVYRAVIIAEGFGLLITNYSLYQLTRTYLESQDLIRTSIKSLDKRVEWTEKDVQQMYLDRDELWAIEAKFNKLKE